MGLFSRKKKQETPVVNESNEELEKKFISENLLQKRYLFCIEKCFFNFRYQMESEEKVCLA